MFRAMIKSGFLKCIQKKRFLKALILGDVDAMNQYMNDIALETFSSFDVAGREKFKSKT